MRSEMRPWLVFYQPDRGLLAQRLAELAARCQEGAGEQELLLPFELWLQIASHLSHFSALCSLSCVCRGLWPLGRHPLLWEARCREVYSLRGYLACDQLRRHYDWSWQRMFVQRPRLRTDGIYFDAHTKLIKGLIEGRGMKETDEDFYSACGKWSTYYRVFRFYSDGSMFVNITSVSPLEVKRAAAAVTPSRPASLRQRLKDACWGTFTLREEAEHGQGTLRLDARVPVSHDDYPRMKPAEMRYSLCLSGRPGGGATNAEAVLCGHSCVYDAATGDVKDFTIRNPHVSFIAFGASRAAARHVWLSHVPLAEFDGGVKLSELAAEEAAAREKVLAEESRRL